MNKNLKAIGTLYETGEGEYVFIPATSNAVRVGGPESPSGVVRAHTPEEARIAKEKEEDLSLDGRLKKHEERTKVS